MTFQIGTTIVDTSPWPTTLLHRSFRVSPVKKTTWPKLFPKLPSLKRLHPQYSNIHSFGDILFRIRWSTEPPKWPSTISQKLRIPTGPSTLHYKIEPTMNKTSPRRDLYRQYLQRYSKPKSGVNFDQYPHREILPRISLRVVPSLKPCKIEKIPGAPLFRLPPLGGVLDVRFWRYCSSKSNNRLFHQPYLGFNPWYFENKEPDMVQNKDVGKFEVLCSRFVTRYFFENVPERLYGLGSLGCLVNGVFDERYFGIGWSCEVRWGLIFFIGQWSLKEVMRRFCLQRAGKELWDRE